jgi:hypothetical protein
MKPSLEYPDKDGKWSGVKHNNNRLVRGWNIESHKAVVLEFEKRNFYLLIFEVAMKDMPYDYYRHSTRFFDGYCFDERDMSVVEQYHPKKWVKAFEKISGKKSTPDFPLWYREELILTGDHPFSYKHDTWTWLNARGKGWKEQKSDIPSIRSYAKRIGQGRVSVEVWPRKLEFRPILTPKLSDSLFGDPDGPASKAKWEEFYKGTKRELQIKGSTGKDIEAMALEVSKAVKAYRPKPERKVLTENAKQLIKKFDEAVRKDILDSNLGTYDEKRDAPEMDMWRGKEQEGRTTREIAEISLWSYGGIETYERYLVPAGFVGRKGRKEASRLFRKVLDQMLKEGLLIRIDNKWWKKKTNLKSAQAVAARYLESKGRV